MDVETFAGFFAEQLRLHHRIENLRNWHPRPEGTGKFGGDVVQSFLKENGLQHILRAHQLCMEGFQVLYDGAVCTVWSAPNYCYRCGNEAAIMEVDEFMKFSL